MRVGDGKSCSFRIDNWSPFGNIRHFLSSSTSLGIPSNALLSDLHSSGSWRLPHARSEAQVSLQAHLSTVSLSHVPDSLDWVINGRKQTNFNTGLIYWELRDHLPTASWHTAIWIKGGIPKHMFLSWLVTLNRCPTKDRILGWGLQTNPLCTLCNSAPETRDHLFFDCPFSYSIWSVVSLRCNLQPPRSWNSCLTTMVSLTLPVPTKRLLLIAWQATIYNIWTERNHRLHRNIFRSPPLILSSIQSIVRNRISSFRHQNPDRASLMMQIWLS